MTSELEKEELLQEILQLFSCGYGATRIAREMGGRVSHEYVQRALREATAALRARNAEHIDTAFMQQDLAIMMLYQKCVEEINRATVFPEKAVKCAILLMERRARLLGMDRGGTAKGAGAFEWLDKAGPDELARIAKSYGISIPTPFAGTS